MYTWDNYIRVNPYPRDMGARGYFLDMGVGARSYFLDTGVFCVYPGKLYSGQPISGGYGFSLSLFLDMGHFGDVLTVPSVLLRAAGILRRV